MKADFKVYGHLKSDPQGQLHEIGEVGLFFDDAAAMRKFAEFVARCVDEYEEHPDWHEHYIDHRRFKDRYPDIQIGHLDARNR